MDEQRFQAYLRVIEQLLDCPQGQEVEVLQANAALVDAALLRVMEQHAAHLESQADWLRRFAAQLAQELGLGTANSKGTENAAQFLLETLWLVAESEGNRQQIYPIWEQQRAQFSPALLEVLPQVVTQILQKTQGGELFYITTLVNFGNLIGQFPSNTYWLNREISIVAYEQALQILAKADFLQTWKFWAQTQSNLALAYILRICGERADNLERAIAACEQVLQVYTRSAFPEEWAQTQNNLAIAYTARVLGEKADNLERAIAAYEQALEVRTCNAFPEDWAHTQHNLAIAYTARLQGEKAENLERAITACEQALQIRKRNAFPEQWAQTQTVLASAYTDRICGERAENLERAIAACEQALEVHTRDGFPEQWTQVQNTLAIAYTDRIHGERADNLERAIAAYEQSLEVRTSDALPEQWAQTQGNLALAYASRIRGERAENLERAIAACEQALQIHTRDAFPEEWARMQNNLGLFYADRTGGERAENLERAIAAYEQALEVRTRNAFPVKWAQTQHNLAIAYASRIRGERAKNLERAITACEQALEVRTRNAFPEHWAMTQASLASAYHCIQREKAENPERAITACKQALQVYTCDTFPKECQRISSLLGNIYLEQQAWSKAASAYATALSAAEVLYQACIFLDGKTSELIEAAGLFRRAAYTCARVGELKRAIEILEQGRARGLSESLNRDRADLIELERHNPHLFAQYQDIVTQFRTVEAQERAWLTSTDRNSLTPEAFRAKATHLRQNLTATINLIRQVEGYADFLAQPSFNNVHAALLPNRPLVYLVSTAAGSLALIVTESRIADVWFNDFTGINLIDLLGNTWLTAYAESQADFQGWLDAIDQTTHQLWQPLMEPLTRHLKNYNFNQATLIPTGYFGFLPLHTAWTEDPNTPTGRHYALDDIHFTYAPNAKSLTAAQEIATRTPADSILAIDNPRNDLPNSEQEVQAAITHFPQHQVLRHGEAAITSVREALQHCNILHLSCHGTANLTEPLTSGLLMSDGLLTLKDILDLKLAESAVGGIRLAILSACETGLTGIENADEAIGLPTGLLQAGVAGVIASLWAVDDLSTRLLLVKFYELWREKKLPPDQALRQAQIWLRDSTDGEKEDFFPDFIALDRSDRSFTHPYHWAAFSYTGV